MRDARKLYQENLQKKMRERDTIRYEVKIVLPLKIFLYGLKII